MTCTFVRYPMEVHVTHSVIASQEKFPIFSHDRGEHKDPPRSCPCELSWLRVFVGRFFWLWFRCARSSLHHLRIAMIRRGAPLPPSIFMGRAITSNPLTGSASRLATFSSAGMPALNRIRWL